MADYDYTSGDYPAHVNYMRDRTCLQELLESINNVHRLSILYFPDGKKDNIPDKYKRRLVAMASVLPEFSTKEKSGAELWAQYLGSFTPGTSYMEDYNETQSVFDKTKTCEFRLEVIKERHVSAIIKQCWINGVRYCYEEPNTEMAKFCLSYWNKDMRPYQSFQLYLLAHALTDGNNGHTTMAYNPYFCDEAKYRELLNEHAEAYRGTGKLGKRYEYDGDYNVQYNETARAVQRAYRNIIKNRKAESFETLVSMWKEEK